MACFNCFWSLFKTFSIFVFLFQIFRFVIPWIYENFIGPILIGSKINLKNMGNWALITGATDGIGKSYAKELARKGFDIILVSRSKDKLDFVAKEIESSYKVKVKIIEIDFTEIDTIYKLIEYEINGLNIGVLVNNVGISYPYPEYFIDIPNQQKLINDIITCNILSVTNMCRLILPKMVERKKGVIINISSMAAKIPNPLLTVYSASKAFIDTFSENLNTEYKSSGIIIQSVLPGFVVSNMSKIKKSSWMMPTSDAYVRSALKTIGISNHTTGYYPHAIMKLLLNFVSAIAPNMANNYVLKQLLAMRKRALRKIVN